jgi:hypothetical protein
LTTLVGRRARRGASLALLCAALSSGCDSVPPALQVGDAGYTDDELGALTAAQRHRLGLLTALGLAVAESRIDELTRPLIREARDSLIVERYVLEQAARLGGLDEDGLRAAYRADPEHRLTVRHLVILAERWRDREQRARAEERAREALDRIGGGAEFAAVAAEASEEPGASSSGGLLAPGSRGAWVPEFWDAASALAEGEVSGVVETRYGYHVLQLVRRDTVPFDSVRYEVMPGILEVVSALPAARRQVAREPRSVTIERARGLGVAVSHAESEAIRSHWRNRMASLAALFGFQAGSSSDDVKQAALLALGDQQQSVRIALSELDELAPALEEIFPIRARDRPAP